MNNLSIVRAIENVLLDWAKLNDRQRGPMYNEAIEHLKAWKIKLENEH